MSPFYLQWTVMAVGHSTQTDTACPTGKDVATDAERWCDSFLQVFRKEHEPCMRGHTPPTLTQVWGKNRTKRGLSPEWVTCVTHTWGGEICFREGPRPMSQVNSLLCLSCVSNQCLSSKSTIWQKLVIESTYNYITPIISYLTHFNYPTHLLTWWKLCEYRLPESQLVVVACWIRSTAVSNQCPSQPVSAKLEGSLRSDHEVAGCPECFLRKCRELLRLHCVLRTITCDKAETDHPPRTTVT